MANNPISFSATPGTTATVNSITSAITPLGGQAQTCTFCHEQTMDFVYRSTSSIGQHWPPEINSLGHCSATSGLGGGHYLATAVPVMIIDMSYHVKKYKDYIPLSVGSSVDQRIPHELTVSADVSTGVGTSGVCVTTSAGFMRRACETGDAEYENTVTWLPTMLTQDPFGGARDSFRSDATMAKWFFYKFMPLLIRGGGSIPGHGSALGPWVWTYSPTSTLIGAKLVPAEPQFKNQLMAL